MKRNYIRTSVIAVLTVLSVSLIIANPIARAENIQQQEVKTTEQDNTSTDRPAETEKRVSETEKQKPETRLTNGRLKECQSHQAAISNIMTRISDRGQKQIDLFSTITDRVEKFYTDKGAVLADHDTLVSAVADAKAHAVEAVAGTQTASTDFNCEDNDPKGHADSFKTNLKSQINALNDYKTSVKNLIVGIKSVESTTKPTSTTGQENQ